MPRLIKWRDGAASWADDALTAVDDDQPVPKGDVLVSLAVLQRERALLVGQDRTLGVSMGPTDEPESLIVDLPRLSVVALTFPKWRDGRAFSAARVLRERLGFKGELRAVGDVLVDMCVPLVRCGFDAFAPADSSVPEQWTAAAARFRHVYQRAADGRPPAFAERIGELAGEP
jgi:uncharacterized protein (DUF934 family)